MQLDLVLGNGCGRGFLFRLALDDQAFRGFDGDPCPGKLGFRFPLLGRELLDIHAGDDRAGFDEVAFPDQDVRKAPCGSRRDVDLDRLDAAVTAGDPLHGLRRPKVLLVPPAEITGGANDCENGGGFCDTVQREAP